MTPYARPLFAVVGVAALTLGLSVASPARPENGAPIQAKKIKYADLGKLVRSQQGKVVVVDFWATFCRPCMANFHHLVEMRNQYKNDGLVAIAVAVDDPMDFMAPSKIVKFLDKQKAGDLINVQLDEAPELWIKKLAIDGVPCVYVFNRDGRIARKWPDAAGKVDYEEIDKLVAELMKK